MSKDLVKKENESMSLLKSLWKQQKTQDKSMVWQANPKVKAQHNTSKPKFEIDGRDDPAGSIKCVIANRVVVNELRLPGSDDPAPECQSVGGEWGSKYGQCAKCAFNQWKEGADGKKSKACREYNRLALVLADDAEPKVYELKVSSASTKNYKEYVKLITSEKDRALGEVFTKLTLTPNRAGSKQFSTINFEEAGEWLTEDKDTVDRITLGCIKASKDFFIKTEPKEASAEAKAEAKVMTPPTADTSAEEEEEEEVEDAEIVSGGSKVVTISNGDVIPF